MADENENAKAAPSPASSQRGLLAG